MAAASAKLLEMLKFCQLNNNKIGDKKDRKVIDGLTPSTLMGTAVPMREVAILMRVYRELRRTS